MGHINRYTSWLSEDALNLNMVAFADGLVPLLYV